MRNRVFFFFLHFHTRYSQDARTVVFGHIAFFSAPAPVALEQLLLLRCVERVNA